MEFTRSVWAKAQIIVTLVRDELIYCKWNIVGKAIVREHTEGVWGNQSCKRTCILRMQRHDRVYCTALRQMCNIQRNDVLTIKERRLEWLTHALRKPLE